MKEFLLFFLTILVIFSLMNKIKRNNEIIEMISTIDNRKYIVRKLPDSRSAADKLANMAIGIEKCPYNCDNNDNTKIYIKISYEDKEDAKNLYAKWDNTKKSWYYTNDIPDENKVKLNELSSKTQNVAIKFVDDGTIEKKYINISYANKNKAKSLGARWDMSLKKWYYLKNNSEENIIKLRELEN